MSLPRRRFVTLLGGAAAAWPLALRAQQPTAPVIGLLSGVSLDGAFATPLAEIRRGLQETGFVEGQNLTIEYRTADGDPNRLADLAADLVRRQVALILAIGGARPALAAKAATSTIPIVFAMGGDAIETGIVNSINRPEGNVTGLSFTASQLAGKRLDLLHELVPQAMLIGYLDNTVTTSEAIRRDLAAAAYAIRRDLAFFFASTEAEIDGAFAAMAQKRVGALVISPDAYLNSRRAQILSLAERYALPAIVPWNRETVRQGALMNHGPLPGEIFRQAGAYAGRILKGVKPAELPVQLPARYEFVINLRTAKALGLTVPQKLLVAADEVVE
jgi:putative ABC transport system substrate-binding protein